MKKIFVFLVLVCCLCPTLVAQTETKIDKGAVSEKIIDSLIDKQILIVIRQSDEESQKKLYEELQKKLENLQQLFGDTDWCIIIDSSGVFISRAGGPSYWLVPENAEQFPPTALADFSLRTLSGLHAEPGQSVAVSADKEIIKKFGQRRRLIKTKNQGSAAKFKF